MIYLIGGAPRVGKSKLADAITRKLGISNVSTDVLNHALHNAVPTLQIRTDGWETIPDKFFPFLKEFVRLTEYEGREYIIEGDAFFPRHVTELAKEFRVKAIFVGTAKNSLAEIMKHSTEKSWIHGLPAKNQEELPSWIVSKSKMFEIESAVHNIPYFNFEGDGEVRYAKAYDYLIRK